MTEADGYWTMAINSGDQGPHQRGRPVPSPSMLRSTISHAWDLGWNQGNLEEYRPFFASGFVRHSYGGDADLDTVCQHIQQVRGAFPNISTQLEQVVIEGDCAAARWVATASHAGDFLSIPATFRELRVSGMTFMRFGAGQVTEEWATWSPGEMLRQLGIVPI